MEVRNELAQLKPLEVPKIPRLPTLRNPIRFYDSKDPYYVFTNFAEATVLFDGKTWKTSEHLFQAWKVRHSSSLVGTLSKPLFNSSLTNPIYNLYLIWQKQVTCLK